MKSAILLLLAVPLCRGVAQAACPEPRPQGCGAADTSINITACGAFCDGDQPSPHNDTNAINCALDTVGNNGGGEVTIPPGTCMIAPNTNTQGDPNAFLHLYSNLTIRGTGPKSVIRVAPNTGPYFSVFSPPIGTSLNNVTIKDFTVDQGANTHDPVSDSCTPICGQSFCCSQYAIWGWSSADFFTPVSHRITISGMRFDQATGVNTINLGANDELDATIVNNYINFVNHVLPNEQQHDNSAIYLEGSQQVVTGNTFFSTLPQFANMTLETHGGRSTISNNTSINYGGLVNVVATRGGLVELRPNNIVISNNSVICGEAVIQLWAAGLTLRNLAITGNTIQICNQQRLAGPYKVAASSLASGVLIVGTVPGSFENIIIENNIITHEVDDQANLDSWGTALNAILLQTYSDLTQSHIPGNLTNIVIRKNVIKDAPIGGIRIDTADQPNNTALNVRVADNIIIDAGRNKHNQSLAPNAAISVSHQVRNVYIERNTISDTGSSTANGLYSLCLDPAPAGTQPPPQPLSIRTSQNTVRFAGSPGSPGALKSCLPSSPFAGSILADVSGSNDLLISTVTSGPLAVDFMSFRQYIITINTNTGALAVAAPAADSVSGFQWSVGQVITFRFLCAFPSGCTVSFDPRYSTTGDMTIPSGSGRAITFQVENAFSPTVPHSFFELYRSPDPIPNQ